MQYIGNLNIGSDAYIMVWTQNKTRDRFLIFSKYTMEDLDRIADGEEPLALPLELDYFDYNKLGNYTKYLLAGIITSPKGGIEQYIGDLSIIKQFINAYEKIKKKNWNKDQYSEYYMEGTIPPVKNITCRDEVSYYQEFRTLSGIDKFNFKCDNVEFVTLTKQDKSNTSPIGKDDWVHLETYVDKALRDKFKMLGAKTLSILRNEKDLSWYFDNQGKSKRKYTIVNTIEGVKKVVQHLNKLIRANKPFAFDTETTGLGIYDIAVDNPKKDHIVGLSITWKSGQGIYIPFDHVEIDNVDIREALTLLKTPLEQGHIIAHNGVYDMKVMIDAGLYGICDGKGGIGEPINLNVKEDTMILNFNINPSASKGRNGLKYLTHTLLGCDTLELSDIFIRKSDAGLFRYLTEDLVTIYACADTDFTYTLWLKLRKLLHLTGRKVYQLDVKTAYYIARSEYIGNGINVPMLGQLKDINQNDLDTLEELLYVFVGRMGKLTQLAKKLSEEVYVGTITEEEKNAKLEEFQKSEDYMNSRYEFKISSNDEIQIIMYKILNYPVLRVIESSGDPSVDKDTLKDLISFKIENEQEKQIIISEDIYSNIIATSLASKKNEDNVLLEAKEVNSCRFPFAYILSKWRKLEKLKTAFFEPYYRDQMDGRYYAPFKLCNAETGRITNKVQTLIGHLKKLIMPIDKDHYLLVFDFAQVEYRAVAGLAGHQELIQALVPPRADYHREGGAKFYNVAPHEITKAQRSDLKVANFAKLYKMSDPSLSDQLYGRVYDKKKKDENLMKARVLSKRWELANAKEKAMLDRYSDFAVKNRYVENVNGRRRYFKTGPLTSYERAKIERMAGNFPVQSFAADIFRQAYIDFNKRLIAEGISDKVAVTMLIHDEMVCSVHKSISPYFMYKLICDEVMKDIKGHPPYYAGISVCDNWYEGKADLYEAPIEFVQHQVNKPENLKYNPDDWFEDPKSMVVSDITKFMNKVYVKEILDTAIQNNVSFKPNAMDLEGFMPYFIDYFLKPRIDMYMGSYRKSRTFYKADGSKDKERMTDDEVCASIEKVFADFWGVDQLRVKYPNEDWQTIDIVRPDDAVNEVKDYEDYIGEDELILTDDLFDDDDTGLSAMDADSEDDKGDSMFVEEMSVPTKVLDELGHFNEDDEEDDFDIMEYVDDEGVTRTKAVPKGEFMEFDEDTRVLCERSGRLYINVTGMKRDDFQRLHAYLVEHDSDVGLGISYILNGTTKDIDVKVNNLDTKELSKIMGFNFYNLQLM